MIIGRGDFSEYSRLTVESILRQYLDPTYEKYTPVTDPQEFDDLIALLTRLAPEYVVSNFMGQTVL